MKRGSSLVVSFLVLAVVMVTRAEEEKEKKVPLDKVPKAVLEAIKAKFPEAELLGAEQEKEDGKLVYEINLKFKGAKHDVTVTPEGKITVVEKTIAAKDLPRAVAQALQTKYPAATIKLVEEISKDDKITAYEARIVTADKKMLEVEFDPAGKFIKEEKKDKKEEKK